MKTKFTRRIVRFLPALIFTTILIFLYLEYSVLNILDGNSTSNAKDVITLARNSIMISLIGITVTLAVGILYFYFVQYLPLKTLEEKLKAVTEKDAATLQQGLTELAYGNLTRIIKIDSEPIASRTNGFIGELIDVFNKLIQYLKEAGKEYNSATDEPCQRLFYVGADSYLEGRTCAEEMGKILNGKGKVAIIVERFDMIGQELRRKGFTNLLKEKYPLIQIIDVAESEGKDSKSFDETKNFIEKYTDLNGVYIAHGGSAAAASSRAISAANRQGKIKIVGHDLGKETMQCIMNGSIAATISQDEVGQGHDTTVHLFNSIVAGWTPSQPRILSKMEMVTPENYSQFWHPDRGLIESDETKKRRAKPIKKSNKEIKIAFLGREGHSFWESVKSGVDRAANELKEYNAKVEWVIPAGSHTSKGFNISAEYYGKAIDELAAQKYDGICVGIYDKNLIGYINRAVSKGVSVCSYNSEPLSFRGLFQTLNKRTKNLLDISTELVQTIESALNSSQYNTESMNKISESLNEESTSLNNASINMNQIRTAIEHIAHDSHIQKQASDEVAQSAYQISKAIESIKLSSNNVAESSKDSISVAAEGSNTVQHNLNLIRNIESLVKSFAERMEMLNKRSDQIEDIIKSIDEISGQTNLLALNAAIEAARAGEAGRGFAIVADEVKNLSGKSANATKQTSDLISGIKNDINSASQSIKEIVSKVKEGALSAENSGSAISKLFDSSVIAGEQIQTISDASNSVADNMTGLLSSIDKIKDVIEQNMSATEELSMAIKETVEMISNISGLSDSNTATVNKISEKINHSTQEIKNLEEVAEGLSNMANELQAGIVQFKVSKE